MARESPADRREAAREARGEALSTSTEPAPLMRAPHAESGVFVSVLSKVCVQLATVGGTAVLARLLAPSDFGLIAMVMAIVGVGHLFKDLGLSAATIQAAKLSQAQINSLFWINAGLGLTVCAAVWLLAPTVAAIYKDPRLLDVTRACALLFALGGIAAQPMALLRRSLRFSRLALVTVTATLIGQAAGIVAALTGAGYWSLVIATLTTALVTLLLGLGLSGIRLQKPALEGELRSLLHFGGHLVGFALLGFVALNAHNLFLGLFHDEQQVGLYHAAFMIMTLLFTQIADPLGLVMTPKLARLQDDVPAYNEKYLEGVALIAAYAAGLSGLLFVCADDIVHLVLGSQWDASATVLRLLALALLPQALCGSTAWLYMSHGDTRAVLRWGVGGWGTLTILLLLAAPAGKTALASAYAAGMVLLTAPCIAMATHRVKLPVWRVLRAALPALLAALFALPALAAPMLWFADWPALLRLGVGVPSFALLYLGLLVVLFRQGPILRQFLPQFATRRASALAG